MSCEEHDPVRYGHAYAIFYDRFHTDWTAGFSSALPRLLADGPHGSHRVIDLCCGTGVSAAALASTGRVVHGLDLSPGMLRIAEQRLTGAIESGWCTLEEGDLVDLHVEDAFDAAVCLDGVMNHLRSIEVLEVALGKARKALVQGGRLVFDVLQPAHFEHWNQVRIWDQEDAVIIKRGVWDRVAGSGLLRISGAIDERQYVDLRHPGDMPEVVHHRVEQTLWARAFSDAQVRAAAAVAGFATVEALSEGEAPTRSPGCGDHEGACRVVYVAIA